MNSQMFSLFLLNVRLIGLFISIYRIFLFNKVILSDSDCKENGEERAQLQRAAITSKNHLSGGSFNSLPMPMTYVDKLHRIYNRGAWVVPSAEHGTPGLNLGDDLRVGRLSPRWGCGLSKELLLLFPLPLPHCECTPPSNLKKFVIHVIHI